MLPAEPNPNFKVVSHIESGKKIVLQGDNYIAGNIGEGAVVLVKDGSLHVKGEISEGAKLSVYRDLIAEKGIAPYTEVRASGSITAGVIACSATVISENSSITAGYVGDNSNLHAGTMIRAIQIEAPGHKIKTQKEPFNIKTKNGGSRIAPGGVIHMNTIEPAQAYIDAYTGGIVKKSLADLGLLQNASPLFADRPEDAARRLTQLHKLSGPK